MSNFSFSDKKCGTCSYFMGDRKIVNGWFSGESVECDSCGTCCNQRCSYYNQRVYSSDHCYSYAKWDCLTYRIEENKRRDAERREIESREAKIRQAEQEEKERQYRQWYNSLSPEEKRAEDARIEAKKQAEAQAFKRNLVITLIIVVSLATLFGLVKLVQMISFVNSPTGQISSWIYKNSSTNVFRSRYPMEGYKINYSLQYYEKGYETAGKKYSFMASVLLTPEAEHGYSKCYGMVLFNYGEMNNAYLQGQVLYNGVGNIYPHFDFRLRTCPEIEKVSSYNSYDGAGRFIENEEEAEEDSWRAIKVAIILTNSTLKQVNISYSMW